jgi:hypothetical protein
MSTKPTTPGAIKHKPTMSAKSTPMPRSKAVGAEDEWAEF